MNKENITKYIGRRIRFYRESKKMTQKELGSMIGVKHNTVSLYESGENRPGDKTLFAIAQTLGVGIDDLFPPTRGNLVGVGNKIKEKTKLYVVNKIAMLPIVGRVSCGDGIIAYEEIEGYEPVPEEWTKGGKHFCLRAKGDSMIGARIHEGDLLLIREQPEVENGEIAVVLIGEEAVLKRIFRNNGQLVLQSENPSYPPKISSPEEIIIVGKLKKIIITL